MKKICLGLFAISLLLGPIGARDAQAEESKPIQLSLVPSIQIFDR